MIFRLQIDPGREEEIVATVHRRTPLIDEIERLAAQDSITDQLPGYCDDEITMLDVNQVECFFSESDKTYLFTSKDGAFSFANEVPGVFTNARKADGFVEITSLEAGKRIALRGCICENCRQILIQY